MFSALPDDVVLDSAKLPLLGEREMLPWCAAAVALVQLVPDLIPDFVARATSWRRDSSSTMVSTNAFSGFFK